MEKVITIFDWWDGPLCGLTTFQASICIYERIFDEGKDDWSDEYYLTPVDEDSVDLLLKDWNAWCKKIQGEDFWDDYPSDSKERYLSIIESSPLRRIYKRTAAFYIQPEDGTAQFRRSRRFHRAAYAIDGSVFDNAVPDANDPRHEYIPQVGGNSC